MVRGWYSVAILAQAVLRLGAGGSSNIPQTLQGGWRLGAGGATCSASHQGPHRVAGTVLKPAYHWCLPCLLLLALQSCCGDQFIVVCIAGIVLTHP